MQAIASTLIICVVLFHLQLFNMHLNISPGITNSSLEIFSLKQSSSVHGAFQSPPPKIANTTKNDKEWPFSNAQLLKTTPCREFSSGYSYASMSNPNPSMGQCRPFLTWLLPSLLRRCTPVLLGLSFYLAPALSLPARGPLHSL